MAMMDKLMFWKKKEDFGGLGDLGDLDRELGFGEEEKGMPAGGENLGLDMPGEEDFGLGKMPGESESYAVPQQRGMQAAGRQGMPPIPTDYEAGEPGLKPTTLGYGKPPHSPIPSAVGPQAYAAQPVAQGAPSDIYRLSKDVEILSIKVDSLRSALESINQRLINMEQILRERRW